jgi:HKD family nuclease
MKLLLSNKKPLETKESRFFDLFEGFCSSADSIHISTGYVSIDSILYLHKNLQKGAIPRLDLVIGMHHFDGFTRAQYDASIGLARYLRESNKGSVSISTAFPYHGKVYCFQRQMKQFAAIIGSSNLTALGRKDSFNFEVDIALEDPKIVSRLLTFHEDLKKRACRSLEEWQPKPFIEEHKIPGAEKLTGRQTSDFWKLRLNDEFLIPLKAEARSNLNVSFGKGRANKNGFIRPRPWHEVELIVPSKITAQTNYPKLASFKVVTDDGWLFPCRTSGDYSKNFRSKNDLCILGAWIKNQLTNAGLLKVGDLVTSEMLNKFGKELKLIKTKDQKIWLLELCSKK